MQYYYIFISISKNLISRKIPNFYIQCQQFLKEFLEKIVREIFYSYDINLEADNSLDFEDLLDIALVFVKYSKYMADFILIKDTNLINEYTKFQKKVSPHLNIIEPLTYMTLV